MADIIDVNIGDQVLEVYWQDEVELNLDMDLMYIKSGQKEIQDYVDNVSKPEIDNYIETEAKPIVTEVVNTIAEPLVNEYIETVTKPAIDEYFNEKKPEIEDLVSQAENYASNSQTSAQASASSALVAENALTTLTTTATDNFNANAESKTNAFNTNAADKQAQVDASANAAKESETDAAESATHAATSATDSEHYSEDSRIWAEGSDSEVQGLGGVHSSKVWSETAQAVVDGKQDIATAVNYKNITNCITEIPQDIKLELKDGKLTLKAGSKVYVPNGKNTDGSLKFDEYITSNDIVDNDFGNASKEVAFLATKKSDNQFIVWPNTLVVSGTSAPDFSGSRYWGVWYDTANNIIKTQDGTNEWKTNNGFSLPLCLVSSSSSAVTSVDQVFNGFGYIGSTVFALPGVKGLIPNGRNADGSLKNIEFTVNGVKIWNTVSSNLHSKILYDLSTDNLLCPNDSTFLTRIIYSEKENIWTLDGTRANYCELGSFVAASASPYAVTSFAPKTVFHALGYNDKSTISGWAMPSTRHIYLTPGASGATYTAPANGWFAVLQVQSNTGHCNLFSNSAIGFMYYGTAGTPLKASIPVKKGDIVTYGYTNVSSIEYLYFVYAEGEN